MSRKKYIKNINIFKVVASKWILGMLMFCLFLAAPKALGIGAASFASGASKDIAESPTAEPERHKGKDYKSTRLQDYKFF